MPELKLKYANTVSAPYQTTTQSKSVTYKFGMCPQCGYGSSPFREYVHPNYGCVMQEWICPRCRHIWIMKKR